MNTRKQQLEAMLAQDPQDTFLRYGLAMEYASEGDDEAAARLLNELIARNPDYVPAYLQGGRTLVRLGRDEEARTVYRTGLEVAQRTGNTHAAGELAGFLQELEG